MQKTKKLVLCSGQTRHFFKAGCWILLSFASVTGMASADQQATAASPTEWVEPTLDMTVDRQSQALKEDLVRRLSPGKARGTLVTATDVMLGVRFLPEANSGRGASTDTVFYPFKMGKNQSLADPQFLPGGQEAIVKVKTHNALGQGASYQLYQINFLTLKLKKLTGEMLVHDAVSLSADGRYIAYMRGVDREGQPLPGEIARLCILDRQSERERTVMRDNALVTDDWRWTPQNTLIVTKLTSLPGALDARPHLYEVAATGGEPKLLVRDGWRPRLSPDGTRIAFFGALADANPGELAANWATNPRGAYLCVAKRDGSERRAFLRQTGAYPVLQWEQDSRTVMTVKAKQWVPDIGDNRIHNFQPLRTDEYKGGLIGLLDTESGDWQTSMILDDGVSPRDFQNRYPKPGVDYTFLTVGPAGDGSVNYVRGRKTEKTEQGTITKDLLWAVNTERRSVHMIMDVDGANRGFDWLDASAPDAVRPTLPLPLRAPRPLKDVTSQLKVLLETLPPSAGLQEEVIRELAQRAEQEIVPLEMPPAEGLKELRSQWQKGLNALDRKDDKAHFAAVAQALILAQQLLADDSDVKRAHGVGFAIYAYQTIFNRDNELGAKILFAFAAPITADAQKTKVPLTGYFVDSLATSARYFPAPENFAVEVFKIILAQTDPNDLFDGRANTTRLQIARELAQGKNFDEALIYLKQVKDEPYLTQAKELIASYEKQSPKP